MNVGSTEIYKKSFLPDRPDFPPRAQRTREAIGFASYSFALLTPITWHHRNKHVKAYFLSRVH